MIKWPVIWGFINKEMSQNLRDPVMLRLLFVVPILQIILFGTALNNETHNIKLAVFGKPKDVVLFKLKEKALASGWFIKAWVEGNDPFEEVQSGRADVSVVTSSKGLTHIEGSDSVELQFLIDSTNSVRAMSINNYLNQIINQIALQDKPIVKSMDIIGRVLYNPGLKTSFFLIPGLMGVMACIITVLLTSMGFAREKEMGTLETILSAPVNKIELMLGKGIPSILMALFNMIVVCIVAMLIFKMPFRGQFGLFLLAAIVFIICTVIIGIAIASVSKTQQQAMMGSFLFIFPALLLSGMMFPVENMPEWMLILTELNPLTHFNFIVRNIILKGGDIGYVFQHLSIIFLIGSICSVLAYKNI